MGRDAERQGGLEKDMIGLRYKPVLLHFQDNSGAGSTAGVAGFWFLVLLLSLLRLLLVSLLVLLVFSWFLSICLLSPFIHRDSVERFHATKGGTVVTRAYCEVARGGYAFPLPWPLG